MDGSRGSSFSPSTHSLARLPSLKLMFMTKPTSNFSESSQKHPKLQSLATIRPCSEVHRKPSFSDGVRQRAWCHQQSASVIPDCILTCNTDFLKIEIVYLYPGEMCKIPINFFRRNYFGFIYISIFMFFNGLLFFKRSIFISLVFTVIKSKNFSRIHHTKLPHVTAIFVY